MVKKNPKIKQNQRMKKSKRSSSRKKIQSKAELKAKENSEMIDEILADEDFVTSSRGFRGKKAEELIREQFKAQGFKVRDISKNKKRHADLSAKKNGKTIEIEVKEVHEEIKGEKGRIQIEKDYIKNDKLYALVVHKKDKDIEIKFLSGEEVKKLTRGEKSPAKIEFSEINEIPSSVVYSDSSLADHVNFNNDHLLMPSSNAMPASWKKPKKKKEEALRKEYLELGLIPFYNRVNSGAKGRASNEVFDLQEFHSKIETVDIAVEKESLLTKEEKKNNKIGSFGGQNIQAQTNYDTFKGLYFQKGLKGKGKDEVPFFFKANVIKVDSDDTGHYIAYMNEKYSAHKAKEIYFGKNKGEIDMLKVNRFLAKQIISSMSYQRNKAIAKAINKAFSDIEVKEEFSDQSIEISPLSFRNASGDSEDLSVSEEQLAICHVINASETSIRLETVDNKEIVFDYEEVDLDETKKPVLTFEAYENQDVEPLDSDSLLRIGVDRLGLEPDSVQSMLEAMYKQGWINYPRSDTIKAQDEPVYLLRELDKFKGTENERKLLSLIDAAHNAYINDKPFRYYGDWVLRQGTTEIRKENQFILVDEQQSYSDLEFDISIITGISPIELTTYLTTNDIATPATRTSILSSLRQAGIITLSKDRTYKLDTRGLYFASGYDYLLENNIAGIDLKRKISQPEINIDEIIQIVNSFSVIDQKEFADFIKEHGEEIINMRNDLTILESY